MSCFIAFGIYEQVVEYKKLQYALEKEKTYQTLAADIEEAVRKININNMEIEKKISNLRSEVEKFSEIEEKILYFVKNIKTDSDFNIASINVIDGIKNTQSFNYIAVKLNFNGYYRGLMNFLTELCSNKYLVIIDSIDIKIQDNASPSINGLAEFKLLY
jgi:hypothetical protein